MNTNDPETIIERPTYKNGLSSSPSFLQVLLFIVEITNGGAFYFMTIFAFPNSSPEQISIIIIYSLLYVGVFIFSIISMAIDPTDPTIYYERECREKNEAFPSEDYDYECNVCKTHVLNRSKHCGTCNRCTQEFDHHCKWLNNCIGKANYKYFISLIIIGFSSCLFHSAICCFLFYSFTKGEGINYLKNTYSRDFTIVAWVLNIYSLLSCLGLSLLLGQLIITHIYIYFKGMTTYEYIMAKREEEKQKLDGIKTTPHSSKTVVKVQKQDESKEKEEKEKIEEREEIEEINCNKEKVSDKNEEGLAKETDREKEIIIQTEGNSAMTYQKREHNSATKFNLKGNSKTPEEIEVIHVESNPSENENETENKNKNKNRISLKDIGNKLVNKIVNCSNDDKDIENPRNSIHTPRENSTPISDQRILHKYEIESHNLNKRIIKDRNTFPINDQALSNDDRGEQNEFKFKLNNEIPNSLSDGSTNPNKKSPSDGFEMNEPDSESKKTSNKNSKN